MLNTRQLPKTDYLRLKAATRELVSQAGGQEAAARVSRLKSHVTVGRYGRPQDGEFMPIDVAADLEAEIGAAPVTRALAALAGLIVIPRPPVDGDAAIVRQLGEVAREAGEAIGRIGEALADDGRVTADEVARLRLVDEVDDVLRAAATMRKILTSIETEG